MPALLYKSFFYGDLYILPTTTMQMGSVQYEWGVVDSSTEIVILPTYIAEDFALPRFQFDWQVSAIGRKKARVPTSAYF